MNDNLEIDGSKGRNEKLPPKIDWKKVLPYPQSSHSEYYHDLDLAQERNLLPQPLGNAFRREDRAPDWDKAKTLDKYRNTRVVTKYSPFFHDNDEMRAVIDNKTDLENSLAMLYRSRAYEHLPRLLSHTDAPACAAFAVSLVRHIDEINQQDIKSHTYIPDSKDGDAAKQFYTIGPYLLNELMEKGLSEADAFKEVLEWSKNRNDNREGSATYPGLSTPADFFLNKDGDHYSHTLAKKIAKHIVGSAIGN